MLLLFKGKKRFADISKKNGTYSNRLKRAPDSSGAFKLDLKEFPPCKKIAGDNNNNEKRP